MEASGTSAHTTQLYSRNTQLDFGWSGHLSFEQYPGALFKEKQDDKWMFSPKLK